MSKEFKYGMSMNLQTTHHHPFGKGAAKESPQTLVEKGYAKTHNYAHVASELRELANINEKRHPSVSQHFRRAEELAHSKAVEAGDYKKSCTHCGRRHEHKRKVRV